MMQFDPHDPVSAAESFYQQLVDLSEDARAELSQLPGLSTLAYECFDSALRQRVPDAQLNLYTALIGSESDETSAYSVLDLICERLAGRHSWVDGRLLYSSLHARLDGKPQEDISVLHMVEAADEVAEVLMRDYQHLLDTYWRAPGADRDERPARRLAQNLSETLLTQARLLHLDQLLSDHDKAMVEGIVNQPSGFNRGDIGPKVYSVELDTSEVRSRPISLVGMFIVAERAPRGRFDATADVGRVLLFTLTDGLLTFPSLQALTSHVRTALAGEKLHDWVTLKRQAQVALDLAIEDRLQLRFSEVMSNVFDACVSGLTERQSLDVAYALNDVEEDGKTLEWLHGVEHAAHLTGCFDPGGFLVRRAVDLISASQPPWLSGLNPEQKNELFSQGRQVMDTRLRHQAVMADLPDLLTFAKQQLDAALSAKTGRAVDSAQVFVTEARVLGLIPHFWKGLPWLIYSEVKRGRDKSSALDKALSNISILDVDYWLTALVVDGSGQEIADIHPDLVKEVVRELNVGRAYEALFNTTVSDLKLQARRDSYNAMFIARLRARVLGAELSGQLSAAELMPLNSVIDTPDQLTRLLSEGDSANAVRYLCLSVAFGEVVRVPGMYLIGGGDFQRSPLLIYDAFAEQGQCFYPFRSGTEYVQRLTPDSALGKRVLQQARLTAWQATAQPLLEGVGLALPDSVTRQSLIVTHWLDGAYEDWVSSARVLLDQQSVTNSESWFITFLAIARPVAALMAALIHPALGLVVDGLLSVESVVHALDAYNNERYEEAIDHVGGALTVLLPLSAVSAGRVARPVSRVGVVFLGATGRLELRAVRSVSSPQVSGIERKYAVPTTLRNRRPDVHGLYHIDDRLYVKNRETYSRSRVYQVERTADPEVYRVINPNNLAGYKPPIRRDRFGYWQVDRHHGLRGGMEVNDAGRWDFSALSQSDLEAHLGPDPGGVASSSVQGLPGPAGGVVQGAHDVLAPLNAVYVTVPYRAKNIYIPLSRRRGADSMLVSRDFTGSQLDTINQMLIMSFDRRHHQRAFSEANIRVVREGLASYGFKQVSEFFVGKTQQVEFILAEHPGSANLYAVYPKSIEISTHHQGARLSRSYVGEVAADWQQRVQSLALLDSTQTGAHVARAIRENRLIPVIAGMKVGLTAELSELVMRKLQFV